ncbi:MAG: TIGR00341 family protein [Sulfurimonas sp.]|uniref:TIGR00341 family protein n=1 Tax=Sulfurimonas sp. TaxID=2022749 RepID=UPI0025F28507|nr:TIGR00341 family protein [Sulfurimonas sp.]MCK9491121.1 TIGR00341 family protein [Sulfurimonas sp.]
MIEKVFLVTTKDEEQTSTFNDLVLLIKTHYKLVVELKYYSDIIETSEQKSFVLLYLSDERIKIFFKNHLKSDINIAILPTAKNPKTISSYGVSSDIHEALEDALDISKYMKVDILLCNGEPTFTNIVIGDVHGLNNASLEKKFFLTKIKEFFVHLTKLSFRDFTFTTAKDYELHTASTGIMILEHNVKHARNNIIHEEFSFQDGKLNAFILSPTSVISYVYYLFLVFFYSRFSLSSLPKSIGVIKTSKLTITSSKPMDFKIDESFVSSKAIELEIIKEALSISLGRSIKDLPKKPTTEDDKDTIKTSELPKGEIVGSLLSETVPLFKRAEEDDFKDLFSSLRESSKFSSIFIVLMVLSTLLATTGLFQNSAPVIIGAMILAPLMGPIISLAMGVVRAENLFITNSLKTLAYGIVTALFFSCIYTYSMPLSELTPEMRGRLNPNVLDLMVAIISGIAGAYANSKSEVAKSLAGVAIAVALIPPLSVTGIGIGWGNIDIIYGSFLLFITNLVGITLSASLTFLVLGYAPLKRAKKGLVYTSIILALVTIPLIFSFAKLIKQNSILSRLNNKTYIINSKKVDITVLEVDLSSKIPLLYIKTRSDALLSKEDLVSLKKNISKHIDDEVALNVSMRTVVE